MTTINIAKDFSRYPIGRYEADGPNSGERFRERKLVPALRDDTVSGVEVLLDGVAGYPSSFLEEAFGGLVRVHGMDESGLRKKLHIRAEKAAFETYIEEIWTYIAEAEGSQTEVARAELETL
ncbi:MAG: STAS-like domain-containing protein [Pseudomonadota bacterium]